MLRTIFIIILLSTLSSAWAAKLIIKSNQEESEIMVRSTDEQKDTTIGKTPFETELADIRDNYTKSDSFILTITKDGFEPYRLLVTPHANADIELNINMEVSKDIRLTKKIDELIEGLFDSQRLIRTKNYGEAMKKLDDLEDKFSQFSSVFEVKASVFYLQKDFPQALSFYRKAFNINPDNLDAYRMKVYLEKNLAKEVKE